MILRWKLVMWIHKEVCNQINLAVSKENWKIIGASFWFGDISNFSDLNFQSKKLFRTAHSVSNLRLYLSQTSPPSTRSIHHDSSFEFQYEALTRRRKQNLKRKRSKMKTSWKQFFLYVWCELQIDTKRCMTSPLALSPEALQKISEIISRCEARFIWSLLWHWVTVDLSKLSAVDCYSDLSIHKPFESFRWRSS